MSEASTSSAAAPSQDLTPVIIDANVKEKRHNIPTAVFFKDVHSLTVLHGAESLITSLQTLKDKYTFFQTKLKRQSQILQTKIPDISRAITVITSLQRRLFPTTTTDDNEQQPLSINFELSDSLYACAQIRGKRQTVGLWLGAGVMVEYQFDEARKLLKENLAGAENQLRDCEDGLAFIRDQVNIVDVNMTRVYNAHVEITKGIKGGKK